MVWRWMLPFAVELANYLLKDTSAYSTFLEQIPKSTYSFHALKNNGLNCLLWKRHCGKQFRTRTMHFSTLWIYIRKEEYISKEENYLCKILLVIVIIIVSLIIFNAISIQVTITMTFFRMIWWRSINLKNIYICTRICHSNIKCLVMLTGIFNLGILSFSSIISKLLCDVATLLSFHLIPAFGHWELATCLMQHQHILSMTCGKRVCSSAN